MRLVPVVLLSWVLSAVAFARLGDTLDQAEVQYGLEKRDSQVAIRGKLLEGAREVRFEHAGWNIRCAFFRTAEGQEYMVREEYTKIWNTQVMKAGGSIQIRDFERDALFQAQAGTWTYQAIAENGDDLYSTLANQILRSSGITKVWRRKEDGCIARVQAGNSSMIFEHPSALKHEADLKASKDQFQRQNALRIVPSTPAQQFAPSTPTPVTPTPKQVTPRATQAANPPPAVSPNTPAAVPGKVINSTTTKVSSNMAALSALFVICTVSTMLLTRSGRSSKKSTSRSQNRPLVSPPPLPVAPATVRTVKDLTWDEFELLVGEVYRRQGFEVELCAGTGADGGIDLTLRRNGAAVLVQCKSWNASKVSAKEIREFFGVLVSEKADRGIFVTTGTFTRDARDFANGKNIQMVDGEAFDRLLKQAASDPNDDLLTVRFWAPTFFASAKLTHPDCPFCKTRMVKRDSRTGIFWGCSSYPRCRGKREMRRHIPVG